MRREYCKPEIEIFKKHPIVNVYVSTKGRIFMCPKRHKPTITYGSFDVYGYRRIERNGKGYKVHRLVAECYIPNPNNLPTVDHINQNKADNRVDNLRWADNSLQMINRYHPKNTKRSKKVLQINPTTNEIIRIWESTRECGRNGYSYGNIINCCNNKYHSNGGNVYKGYKWQYINES